MVMAKLNWEKANQRDKINSYPAPNRASKKKPGSLLIRLKFDSRCAGCGKAMRWGDKARWIKANGVFHPGCYAMRASDE